jgi:hypothetical protein
LVLTQTEIEKTYPQYCLLKRKTDRIYLPIEHGHVTAVVVVLVGAADRGGVRMLNRSGQAFSEI